MYLKCPVYANLKAKEFKHIIILNSPNRIFSTFHSHPHCPLPRVKSHTEVLGESLEMQSSACWLLLLLLLRELFNHTSSGVLEPAPAEDTRVYVPAVFGSKSFNLSVYVSTAKYEEMNQVMSGIASCKKKKCYYPNIQVVLKLQRNSKDGLIYFLSKMNNT